MNKNETSQQYLKLNPDSRLIDLAFLSYNVMTAVI